MFDGCLLNRPLLTNLFSSPLLPFLLIHNVQSILSSSISSSNLFVVLSFFIQSSLTIPTLDYFKSNEWVEYDQSFVGNDSIQLHQDPSSELPITSVNYLHLRFKLPDGSFITLFSCLQELFQQDQLRKELSLSAKRRLLKYLPLQSIEETNTTETPKETSKPDALLAVEQNLNTFLSLLSDTSSEEDASKSESRFDCLNCHSECIDDSYHIPGCFCQFFQDCDDCLHWKCV